MAKAARVLGYSLKPTPAPNRKLTVTVFWQPEEATEQPYTVFVHLYNPKTGIIAQVDSYPLAGTYPTTPWVYRSAFADRYELLLPLEPQVGEASLLIGLYDLQTMERLPVIGADADAPNRCVRLGNVVLAEAATAPAAE